MSDIPGESEATETEFIIEKSEVWEVDVPFEDDASPISNKRESIKNNIGNLRRFYIPRSGQVQ